MLHATSAAAPFQRIASPAIVLVVTEGRKRWYLGDFFIELTRMRQP
jgi:hypothetical protein